MAEAATLAVIGAGPKAVAIAARIAAIHTWRSAHPVQAAAIRPPPVLHIFERSARPAAHWHGGAEGYTDGLQEICSSPKFDLVYPETSLLGTTLDFSPFAWRTYVASRGISVTAPSHRQFADYVAWALDAAVVAANGGISVHLNAAVSALRRDGDSWAVETQVVLDPDIEMLLFDGVVVTSPGPAQRRFHIDPGVAARVADAQTYWSQHRAPIHASVAAGHRVAVIGAGGAAAAICVDVLRTITSAIPDPGGIVLVAPQPTLFTRGETSFETQILVDADAWTDLPRDARRQVADHLLSGVVFRRVLEQLEGLSYLPAFFVGRAIAAVPRGSAIDLWCLALNEHATVVEADWIVDASGFDALWFVDLLEEPARTIARRLGAPVLAERIDAHLRLTLEANMYGDPAVIESLIPLSPALHVPFLAGGVRPPGRASLLQLGRVADEILQPYLY